MAGSAAIEVALDVRVTMKLEAEVATEAELIRLVERDPESVRGAILARIASPGLHGEKEAGWLDDDRSVFVTEIVGADRSMLRVPLVNGDYAEPRPEVNR